MLKTQVKLKSHINSTWFNSVWRKLAEKNLEKCQIFAICRKIKPLWTQKNVNDTHKIPSGKASFCCSRLASQLDFSDVSLVSKDMSDFLVFLPGNILLVHWLLVAWVLKRMKTANDWSSMSSAYRNVSIVLQCKSADSLLCSGNIGLKRDRKKTCSKPTIKWLEPCVELNHS